VLEAVALDGATKAEIAEKMGDLSTLRDDVGGLSVDTASTALVGLDAGAQQLIEYPYGCTEQLTSKLVPLVALRGLSKDFGFALPSNADEVAEATVAKILTHQRGDGGFGFWEDSVQASPWVTAYALWGLDSASRAGVPVSRDALRSATTYLVSSLASEDVRRNVGPFVVYVLAERGEPDPGRVSKLFEERESLPEYGKALLLSAMAIGKSDPESITKLATELESTLRIDGMLARAATARGVTVEATLDSDARTTAMILRALLHANPKHPLAAALARGLLADRTGGTWRSTQESAWALLALADYRRAQESDEPQFVGRVFFGETLLAEDRFFGRQLRPAHHDIPVAGLLGAPGSALAFQVDGKGTLFYQARLRYARKELPSVGLDRGYFVDKRLRAITSSKLEQALATVPDATTTRFSSGDLVLADVLLVSPKPRRYVVLDDPLPAGFEAIDMRLATTSGALRGLDDEREGKEGGPRTDVAFTREVRDDRVLFFVDELPAGIFRFRYLARATAVGSFVLPPTRAEGMYAPEVFGRTAASRIEVAGTTP
jgi:uncharacterized protein YfaS (alpha-2-macroglobulin family)